MIMLSEKWFIVVIGLAFVCLYFGVSFLVGLHLETAIDRIVRKRKEKQTHDDYARGQNEGLKEYERVFFKFLSYVMWVPCLNLVLLVLLWAFGFLLAIIEGFKQSFMSTRRLKELVKSRRHK